MEMLPTLEAPANPRLDNKREEISRRLRLDNLPNTPEPVKQAIAQTVAATSLEVQKILGLPEINIELITTDNPSCDNARAYIPDPNKPTENRIEVSQSYLVRVAQALNYSRFSFATTENLAWNIAHEAYHLKEARKFPQRFVRSAKKTLNGMIQNPEDADDIWISDRGEFAAELFAYKYMLSKAPKGLKQNIIHWIRGIQRGSLIHRYKSTRLRRGF